MVQITKCKLCGEVIKQITCKACDSLCENHCPTGHGTFNIGKATKFLHVIVYDRGKHFYIMHKVKKGKAYTTGPHKTLKAAYKYLIQILKDQ